MKCGAIRGIIGGKIPFAHYDTLSFLIVLSFLLARRAPISEPINRFDDKFHLGARVHKKCVIRQKQTNFPNLCLFYLITHLF